MLLLFGISLQSLMIAGGMLLLLLSVEILLRGERVQKASTGEDVGVVPIAFPLLVGPGAITTTMISLQSYSLEVAIPSIAIQFVLEGIQFYYPPR